MLLDGLVALMEELPARSVRLVVFNLEQRRELLRKDGFTLQAFAEVCSSPGCSPACGRGLHGLFENPGGTVDFIKSLLNQEMRASQPSKAVSFPRAQIDLQE